jgi:predicted AAA+ superfamily ATPase
MELSARYLKKQIEADALKRGKIAFISGPRQVGKTTLAKTMIASPANYYSFDEEYFRRAWSKDPAVALANRGPGPVVLDEIHKDRLWKRKLKGLYDQNPNAVNYIVTGSARLETYRRGSDSLLGRYIPYKLHPITVGERPLCPSPDDLFNVPGIAYCSVQDLLSLGGFPEPLLRGSENEAKRWSRLRLDRLVQEDTRDILSVSDLTAFRILSELLPERVGSPLSINALHEDVGKAYATVRSWYQVLEALFFCITVRPYSKRINRAIRAEPKMYLFDLLRIPKDHLGKRLENLTALHLLKAADFWTDSAQGEFSLHFVRDKSKREVDFLLVRDTKPWMLVECKSGNKEPSSSLKYFSQVLDPKHRVQLVSEPGYDRVFAEQNIRVLSYDKFFSFLP